jgi:hypothetical protein
MWHCPHCGAPQAETARCWVCRRSSTTCSTCTHFRRALAGDLGYCGLDARRPPLTGLEQRGCWEPSAAAGQPESPHAAIVEEPHRLRGGRAAVQAYRNEGPPALRDFIPVELVTKEAPAPGRPPRAPVPEGGLSRPSAAVPSTAVPSAAVPPPAAAPPAFVIEPDPGWDERTSLFGDPEG